MKSMATAYGLMKRKMSDGDKVKPQPVDLEHDDDVVDRVMKKRKPEDTTVMADELPAEFDYKVLNDHLESDYDGKNAGDDLGNEQEDMDRRDIVAMIMRKRKDRNPSPA